MGGDDGGFGCCARCLKDVFFAHDDGSSFEELVVPCVDDDDVRMVGEDFFFHLFIPYGG